MSENLLLTEAERERFAAYCEHEAHANDGIAKQFVEAMPGPMGEAHAKRYRTKAAGYMIVAQDLRSWEFMEIKGDE